MITRKTQRSKALCQVTSKQIASKKQTQSVTDAGRGAGKPPRTSYEHLGPWLQLANLLPPPPSADELKQSPGLGRVLRIRQWRALCSAIPPIEFVRRFDRSGLADVPSFTASLDLERLGGDPDQARRFLDLACEVAGALRSLARGSNPDVLRAAGETPLLTARLYENPATSRSEIWIHKGVVATQWVDPFKNFLAALEGTEAMRVRQCPVCSHFFFALRKDRKACSKRCNAVRRVRAWRAGQAEHEYRRKLRTAGLQSQKKKKKRAKR